MVIVIVAVVVIAAVVAVAMAQRPATGVIRPVDRRQGAGPVPAVRADLDRWIEAGLLDSAQAEAIARHEAARIGPPRRISLATEAFGYVGAALATAGVLAALVSMWDDLSNAVHLTVGFAAAVLLVASGTLVIRNAEPALRRLGTVLWFLAVGATALAISILVIEIIELDSRVSEEAVAALISAGAAVVAAVLWLAARTGLQQTALFLAAISSVTATLGLLSGDTAAWMIALTVWGFGLAWTALGWRGAIRPMPVALALGATAVLIGPALGIVDTGWLFIPALATAGASMAISIPTRQVPLLAAGTAGLFLYLTWAVIRYFGDTLGVPLALSAAGSLFIALAVLAGRLRRLASPPDPDPGPGRASTAS